MAVARYHHLEYPRVMLFSADRRSYVGGIARASESVFIVARSGHIIQVGCRCRYGGHGSVEIIVSAVAMRRLNWSRLSHRPVC